MTVRADQLLVIIRQLTLPDARQREAKEADDRVRHTERRRRRRHPDRGRGSTVHDQPPYQLTAIRQGHAEVTYSGHHLTHCLRKLRKDLEAEGLLLCCQGARPNVTLSGMQAQMDDGRFAYTFDAASGRVNKEEVDIFAPAELKDVVTTAVQRAAIFNFFGIEDRGEEA